jgi:Na+/H+ antiporter NhaD/arsenite permease-like protein
MAYQDNQIVENSESFEMEPAWTAKVLIGGGILGALTGLGAAYLLIQRSKRKQEVPSLSASEGIKLGLLIFGLLRSVALLGDDR